MAKTKTGATLLREWRGDRTLVVAAKLLEMPFQNLWEYENEKKRPELRRALRIQRVTGIPMEKWAA